MKKRYFVILCVLILTIVLEALPFGVVLNFANPEGEPFRRFFSYFDPVPFGYAVFGPLLTAFLTCLLLILSVLCLLLRGRAVKRAVTIIAAVAALTSLSPLLYGLHYFTWLGLVISCLLASIALLSHFNKTT